MVGIGASAGGIEALKNFFQHMPADSGMGFVIVLHLSAGYKSMLAEVVARWTDMPVEQATDGQRVLPNHIYVIPPNVLLVIADGRLQLRKPQAALRGAVSIDGFFSSLAADRGVEAVGVVLSGTGSDGALGLKAIKEAGGVTIAQGSDGSHPQYADMPDAAIATGAVDLILGVEAMPERILALRAPPPVDIGPVPDIPLLGTVRPRICAILRTQIGHDFNGYKEQTFMRRVHRRMQFLGLDIEGYIDRLARDRNEVVLLFRELLIGVTSFFRDPEAFASVERRSSRRCSRDAGATSRCGSGCRAAPPARRPIRSPSCCASRWARSRARRGCRSSPPTSTRRRRRRPRGPLPAAHAAGMSRPSAWSASSPPTATADRDAKEVRDLCVFSAHNVIRDPPFSRMDLVSCRNLLIYLDTDLQRRVIPAFHYSLRPGGCLLLGAVGGGRPASASCSRRSTASTDLPPRRHAPPLQLAAAGCADGTAPPRPRDGGGAGRPRPCRCAERGSGACWTASRRRMWW